MLAGAMLIFGIAGPTSVVSVLAREADAIKSSGQLIVCAGHDALPVSASDSPKGFQVEIAQELARRLGVRPVYEWIWSSYQARFTDCDLLLGVARDPHPGSHLKYLQTLSDVQIFLVGSPRIQNLEPDDLAGKRVAVRSGSLAHFRLTELGAEPRVAYRNEAAMLEAVAKGDVFASIVSNIGFAWYRQRHSETAIIAVGTDFLGVPNRYPMTIGLRRADSLTRSDFEELLVSMQQDGTLERILQSYGQSLSKSFDDPYARLDEAVRPPRSNTVRRDLIEKVEELARKNRRQRGLK